MCDTLCARQPGRMLFAKSSDRPVAEVQLVEAHPRRPGGGAVETQYLSLPNAGALALLGSRPSWLWGFEHGVNDARVAIGNEKIFTVGDPYEAPPALIGMDLVRLALERTRTADDAVELISQLLSTYGQGGLADETHQEPYFSSFLVADPSAAWVLETSGRTWAARAVDDSAAISNRITLGRDWNRASPDVAPGADFDAWRNPDAPTGHADRRLEASRRCLALAGAALTPGDLVAHLRDHGGGPWGAPDRRGATGGTGWPRAGAVHPPPEIVLPDGTGVTVCMHVRGYQATAASMVAELPTDPGVALRAWVAVGSPCVSVYVPVFPPAAVPRQLGEPETWLRACALRDRVEADGAALEPVREVLAPLEAELWEEADAIAADPGRWESFAELAGRRLDQALDQALRRVPAVNR